MKMEHTECSETSAYKIQTPGNYPEESIDQSVMCYGTRCTGLVLWFSSVSSDRYL